MIDPRHIEVGIDEWVGLYKESWTGVIAPEAFAHPAKYSRALIRFIYQHVVDCGWIRPGDSVVDPFGGVALGGFDAMQLGLHWTGCELEAKFVGLGNQNIALWNERYSRMPNWGMARLVQGDSRKLSEVLRDADCAVSSPPYATQFSVGGGDWRGYYDEAKRDDIESRTGGKLGGGQLSGSPRNYGQTEGQLGAMKEGDLGLAISSPPYIESLKPETEEQTAAKQARIAKSKSLYDGRKLEEPSAGKAGLGGGYGTSEGNLGAMVPGDHSIAIASPPFPQPYTSGGGINVKGYGDGSDKVGDRTYQSKGGERSEGNLETMDANGFQAAVSSPPYEGSQVGTGEGERKGWRGYTDIGGGTYADEAPVSAMPAEDFWSASRVILEQLFQVIVPGGHAVFVVKAFVRNKKIVDFPGQWAQLCEAVGFRLLHDHRALLTEHYGTQTTMHGEGDKHLTVARKSFFRRLAESKGSPKIDYENVLCFEKPA